MRKILLIALLLCGGFAACASSVYTARPDDPKAVYLDAPEFGAHADGAADDSAAIQHAIDKAEGHAGEGNAGAVAVRFHVAQHAFLTHIDFHMGSGLAALYQVGNEAEDLHFYGGRFGILTEKTSPAWQFTLLDSTFEGQRETAIREHEAQLTLVRDTIRNVPTAIDIDAGYPDELWVKDCRFEAVLQAAGVIRKGESPPTGSGVEKAGL